jgi:hypothetical protein
MEKVVEAIVIGILAMALVGAIAVVGGTIVYLIWPVAIPAVFPKLVAAGTIAAQLTWWQSVCLTWLCSLLLKSSNSNKN